MLDALLRPLKERVLTPLAHVGGRRLSPSAVTLSAFVVGIGAAVLAAQRAYGAALALWIANRVLDGFDGTLARVQGTQSDVGGYLDILLDFVVYAAVPIGLVVGVGTRTSFIAALGLLASFYVNAASWMYLAAVLERRDAGARARGELTTVTMPPGLIGGTETVVCFTLLLLFPRYVAPLCWWMTGLVVLTVVQRLVWAIRCL